MKGILICNYKHKTALILLPELNMKPRSNFFYILKFNEIET